MQDNSEQHPWNARKQVTQGPLCLVRSPTFYELEMDD